MSEIEGKASVEKKALPQRIRSILSYLNRGLYGKEEAVRLALLSAVAGESIFFIGLPGTAKSMISRRIASAFSDFYKDGVFAPENGGYFEYLMNEFSTPDEICGPVNLSALNESPSRYTRLTNGYLPSAKVAFLDEIWKSGPAILNTLLTIVNEKKFHNGSITEDVPLLSLAAASNELPGKNRGLEALWDRFIIRVPVNPVSNDDDFFKLVDNIEKNQVPEEELLSVLPCISEVKSWQTEIEIIKLGNEAKNVITAIRKELSLRNMEENSKDDETWYVSDRRWKKIVHILKTSAFLNGRDAVDLADCQLIGYCIWNSGRQQKEVDEIIGKILVECNEKPTVDIDGINKKIQDFHESIMKLFYKSEEKWCEAGKFRTVIGRNFVKNPEVFEDRESLEFRRKTADTQWYEKIRFVIKLFLKKIEDLRAAKEKSFRQHQFVDQKYRDTILAPLEDIAKQLEDLGIRLEKERGLYADKGGIA